MAELRVRLQAALRGRYTVDREVGRGGMAIVYLAHDFQLERDVALKVLRPELAVTLGPDRFLQEIRLAAGLAHPHILPLHESGEADGLLFYVMPFCTGESLRDRLEREHTLPMADALRIAREVADALAYAHRAGVVHRDIKPENILLQDGHAVVADFGIARAISAAGTKRMTTAGMAVGTREYMSPEQAAGSAAVDGRSDIYSLGCMLFEMLTGSPPAIGTPPGGTTAGSTGATNRAAELATLRPSVPPEVAGVVARMLTAEPGERFQTAGELADALAAPTGVWTPRSLAAERRRRWGAGVAAVVAVSAAVIVIEPKLFHPSLDAAAYAVVSLDAGGSGAGSGLGPNAYVERIWEELERWGLQPVDQQAVQEAIRRRGGTPLTLDEAKQVASDQGAGWLVGVRTRIVGDSIVVEATLYDMSKPGRKPKYARTRIDRQRTLLLSRIPDLADTLLLSVGHRVPLIDAGVGTGMLSAYWAYVNGAEAMARWDLDSAEGAFLTAVSLDSRYSRAHLWLAQTQAWEGRPEAAWLGHARMAVEDSSRLGPRERLLSAALLALGARKYQQACERYRALVALDSRSFPGLFGLGECLRRDHTVVPDAKSPTRWSWRTSLREAERAYERALDVVRSAAFRFPPFSRLSETLFVDGATVRWGIAAAPDSAVFMAYPSWVDDTLAFVPIPEREFVPSLEPPTHQQAIAANQRVLLDQVRQWVQEFPDSSQPFQDLAASLELMGALDLPGSAEGSALAAARRAEATARTAADSVQAVVLQTRLLVKLTHFAQAESLARQAVSRWNPPAPSYAAQLTSLAVLLGKPSLGATWVGGWAQDVRRISLYHEVSLNVVEAAFALRVYAATGAPPGHLTRLAAQVDTALMLQPQRRRSDASPLCDIVGASMASAYPQIGRVPDAGDCPETSLLTMQRALSHGDSAAVRNAFDRHEFKNRAIPPGDDAMEHVYHKAWLLLQIGDTAVATRYADRHLAALPMLRATVILDAPLQTGALVRLMALRARLAAQTGDSATARHWAEPVAVLWQEADPELRPLVAQMRELARGDAGRR